jgi:hypothetical protein
MSKTFDQTVDLDQVAALAAIDDFNKDADNDSNNTRKETIINKYDKELLQHSLQHSEEGVADGAWTFNQKLSSTYNDVASDLETFADDNEKMLEKIDKKITDGDGTDEEKAAKKLENNKARLEFAKLRNSASALRFEAIEFVEENLSTADKVLADNNTQLGYVKRFGDAANKILDELHADTTFVKPEDDSAYTWSGADSKPAADADLDWEGRLAKLVTLSKDINDQRKFLAGDIATKMIAIDNFVTELTINESNPTGFFKTLDNDFVLNNANIAAIIAIAKDTDDAGGENNLAKAQTDFKIAKQKLAALDKKYSDVQKVLDYLSEVQHIRRRVGDATFENAKDTSYFL